MRRLQTILLAGIVGFMALSQLHCLPEPDPREKIMELRVLGIKANPPAAKPNDKVELSALVAIHTNDAITLSWYLCKDTKDAEHGCHDKPNAIQLGEGNTKTVTIPSDYLQTELTPAEKQSGRFLPITMVARAGKEIVVAVKRIVISDNPSNQNPKITDLTLSSEDGQTPLSKPWSLGLDKKYKLTATIDPKSRESYQRIDPEGNASQAQERLYLSWYLTDGAYSKGYLSQADDLENTLETPKEKAPESGKITMYLILRDGRGGVDWSTYTADIK